jgi:hypothetical protein
LLGVAILLGRDEERGVGALDLQNAGREERHQTPRSISAKMSSTFQAVIRRPNFTDLGYRPEATPAHLDDREIGSGPFGAKIELSRTNPPFGQAELLLSWEMVMTVRPAV